MAQTVMSTGVDESILAANARAVAAEQRAQQAEAELRVRDAETRTHAAEEALAQQSRHAALEKALRDATPGWHNMWSVQNTAALKTAIAQAEAAAPSQGSTLHAVLLAAKEALRNQEAGEQERARKDAEENARREAEQAQKEAEQRARKEAEEKARREAERARREAVFASFGIPASSIDAIQSCSAILTILSIIGLGNIFVSIPGLKTANRFGCSNMQMPQSRDALLNGMREMKEITGCTVFFALVSGVVSSIFGFLFISGSGGKGCESHCGYYAVAGWLLVAYAALILLPVSICTGKINELCKTIEAKLA